tara:strand:- start:1177 stop:1482 length:306 start_codon:yes stop_codon:yes gene_type:complete
MIDRLLKKGDLVSYCSPQGDLLGPTHGTLGIVVDGPDEHGKTKVSWNYQSPLHKLFEWFSPSSLKLQSPYCPSIEPTLMGYESPAFLEPCAGEEFKNDDIF